MVIRQPSLAATPESTCSSVCRTSRTTTPPAQLPSSYQTSDWNTMSAYHGVATILDYCSVGSGESLSCFLI